LQQAFHPQLQNGTGNIRFPVLITAQHLREAMANFLSWWYSLRGVRFTFFAKIGFLGSLILPHAVFFLQNFTNITYTHSLRHR
jgi:hypothetical protein